MHKTKNTWCKSPVHSKLKKFQGLAQKLRSFQGKMEFKDFSRLCEPVLFISLLTCRCNTSCFLKLPQDLLSHIRVSMVCSCSISGYSLIIPFTIIRACMEGSGRKKPSTGRIRELPFSWYSGQWQWNQRQKIPILLKSNINGNNILLIGNSEKF